MGEFRYQIAQEHRDIDQVAKGKESNPTSGETREHLLKPNSRKSAFRGVRWCQGFGAVFIPRLVLRNFCPTISRLSTAETKTHRWKSACSSRPKPFRSSSPLLWLCFQLLPL